MRPIPEDWREPLRPETEASYFRGLRDFVERERDEHQVFPPEEDVFRALELTPPDAVRVVILGQDPYPNPGQAHGLCFSVPEEVPAPPSLRNILKELHDDVGVDPGTTDLTGWARQGVLLLNAVLTVRCGESGSHRGRGWERFTDAVVQVVADGPDPTAFLLWGEDARAKATLIGQDRHTVLEAPHPSPQSAWRGFFGSRPFSRANAALKEAGREEVDWSVIAD